MSWQPAASAHGLAGPSSSALSRCWRGDSAPVDRRPPEPRWVLSRLCGHEARSVRNSSSARRLDQRSAPRATPSLLLPRSLHAPCALHPTEVIAALGFGEGLKPKVTQGGILWVPQARATFSSLTFKKRSATTRPRRCTATTPSTASSSIGSPNQARPRDNRPSSAISTIVSQTRILLFVREGSTPSSERAVYVSWAREYVDHGANGRWPSRGGCQPDAEGFSRSRAAWPLHSVSNGIGSSVRASRLAPARAGSRRNMDGQWRLRSPIRSEPWCVFG